MTRTLKNLKLLIVVLAIGAINVTAASAAEFHSTAASTKISATQTVTHKLTTTAGEITCEHATFTGTQVGATVSSVEVAPVYSGCHIIFFGSTISATLNTNGCKYKLYSSGSVDLVCPAGSAGIGFSGSGCTLTIKPQTSLKSVTYTNNASHIDMALSLSGIHYAHQGFTCGTGTGTTGTYVGKITASGQDTSGKAVTISYA